MNQEPRTKNEEPATRSGFTLIELLAAVAVLMIIGLILANVFHQSTIAWEAGLRRVEMSAEGRAALDLMSREISQAVASDDLKVLKNGDDELAFYTSADSTDDNPRDLRLIQYNGNLRKEWALDETQPYPAFINPPFSDPIIGNVGSFDLKFEYPTGYTTPNAELPAWVDIQLELSVDNQASLGVTVRSIGRDDTDGTADDIEN